MLDIQCIREHPDDVKKAVKNRGVDADIDTLLKLDQSRRNLQTEVDELHHQRKKIANEVTGKKPSAEYIDEGKRIREKITTLEDQLKRVQQDYQALLDSIPNIPTEDTPVGADESENKVIRTVGDKPQFDFDPKPHWELGSKFDIIDNERAAKVSGSRFTYLKRELALLQLGLIHYAFDVVTNQETLKKVIAGAGLDVSHSPFIPVIPPTLIKRETLHKMARLDPEEERYHIPSDDLFLVGSAEHSVGSMHMNEIIPEKETPLRYIALSSSFRREAGSHGKDVRGILRMHQFDKVEMESFSIPDHARAEQDLMVAIQEHIMQTLNIPYRVVHICTGDMGDPDARQIDIESWMPGQNRYRETHTSDYVTDYQARRLRTKIRQRNGETVYAHMNDATAVAVGRTIITILENHQQEDGSIAIPNVLHSYLPFTSIPSQTL